MKKIIIKNVNVVNEDEIYPADVLIKDKKICKINRKDVSSNHVGITWCNDTTTKPSHTQIIDASDKYLLPGVIDDHVHFREPGLTHKADIFTESKAAVAGGITSYMEMPNTVPNVITRQLLEEKFRIASERSLANYSFYLGASNDNLEEILKTDPRNVCGVKIFMGSSTGDMLVDDPQALEAIFSKCKLPIAVHCEDEPSIKANTAAYRGKYGENIPIECHPLIRSREACYKSSSYAVELAKKYDTRLHILHLSTSEEVELFHNKVPFNNKKITSEACIHHLWFDDSDYKEKGMLIKWNPAIKTQNDKECILQGVLENKIDVIASDHAPHTISEKQNTYFKAPSGGPLVQYGLIVMLELYHQGKISLKKIVEKMCHAPAGCFRVEKRGYIREGYYADLVIVDVNSPWMVNKANILSKCKWSPFEGQSFHSKITHTFINGHLVYNNGSFDESVKGQRLLFER
ncbi:MAG: dihydroorotase [Bacteroidota bacterium]